MIKVNELRIGNWVALKDGTHVPIRGGGINAMEQGRFECYPIPLTEEILLKFGFEKKGNDFVNHRTDGDIDSVTGATMYISEFVNKEFEFVVCADTYNGYCLTIPYLHQLQNLYFALTGEELQYTP